MSDACFRDPGSGTHARQTAGVVRRFGPVVRGQRPGRVAVAGDVNSGAGLRAPSCPGEAVRGVGGLRRVSSAVCARQYESRSSPPTSSIFYFIRRLTFPQQR
jgi:hypothetical protein